MTVSVALATYNGEKYILKQLDSLLGQTRQPDEVVIIDDCSSDNTPELVKSFIAENNLNWRFSKSLNNSGYIKNFYNCLKQCNGDVIFLCDQDDVWYSEKIEKITAVFENDTSCLAVNSSFDTVDGDSKIITPFGQNKKNTANHGLIHFPVNSGDCVSVSLQTVLVYNISPGCTCAFSRMVVEEYLKTSQCVMPHDWELNVIAAKQNGLRFLNVPLIGYRLHGNNTIGLSNDNSFGPLKMRGGEDVRFNVLQMQKEQLQMVKANLDNSNDKQKRFCACLEKFCQNREKILLKGKFTPCFKNLMLYPKLKAVATIHARGLIGDMVYALKHRKNRTEQIQ